MASIGKCMYKKCENKNICERYTELDTGYEYEFKNICNEKNDYKYMIKKNVSIDTKGDENG